MNGIRLLGVWAHPDDEAYLTAGLMHRVVAAGGEVTCLTATRGEAGAPAVDPRRLRAIGRAREAELRASLAVLGVSRVQILGHRDGSLAMVPFGRGVRAVAATIERVRPDLIVTFGPDGITGHPDHVAVSRWTTAAWQETRVGSLHYATWTEEFMAQHAELHARIGVFMTAPPRGTTASDIVLRLDLDERELDRKRRALAAHASQTTALAREMGEGAYRAWWASETFRAPTPSELAAARPHARRADGHAGRPMHHGRVSAA